MFSQKCIQWGLKSIIAVLRQVNDPQLLPKAQEPNIEVHGMRVLGSLFMLLLDRDRKAICGACGNFSEMRIVDLTGFLHFLAVWGKWIFM